MSSPPKIRIGAYEIAGPLGKGGMGEVFRARDTKLGREVALKLLPEAFAQAPERVARFKREAHVLASLNHPHIAAIYGIEEQDGRLALVLELIPGETLEDRLRRGAIPVDEAIALARQIAEALEEAHEKGVVHRDLKPANVKVSEGGRVKVLDFGLAKALFGDKADSPDLTAAPTLTSPTHAGLIMGTAAYMAPEQARGRTVDNRADIWAFGVVLYEMLSGKRLFDAETISDTLAAVLTKDPDWRALPATTPHAVRHLLRLCLARDPRQRLHSIGDARLELEAAGAPTEPEAASAKPLRSVRIAWAVAFVASLVAAWALWTQGRPAALSHQVSYLDLAYPPGVEPLASLNGIEVSPDGRSVLMIGVRDGPRRLFLRALDRPEAVEIPNTLGVNNATFSPDGRSIAFTLSRGGDKLVRFSLADREPKELTAGVDIGASIAWGSSGLVYARRGALWIMPTDGGEPRVLTTLDAARHEVLHADPLVLPDGQTVLFSSLTTQPGTERIEAVSTSGGPRAVVVERAITPIWSPTGHLLFGRDGAVLAAAFDAERATLRGGAVLVIPEGVVGTQRSGTLAMRLSPSGTLVFLPVGSELHQVVSVGRDGAALKLNLPLARYANPRLSPDRRRLVVESSSSLLETLDMARGTRARLTAAAPGTNFPSWDVKGERVVFRRYNSPFWVATDGSGKEGPVPATFTNDYPSAPGPDPDSILVVRVQPDTSGDIFLISISGKSDPRPLVATRAYEGGPQLSADGRFLLYQSNASGQPEVYLGRYPSLDRRWQVSEGGGIQPRWGGGDREIFYRNGQALMTVPLEASGAEPAFGKPTPVFADDYSFGQGVSIPNYDVTADGRFVMLRREPDGSTLRAVLHWTEELKRILANGGVR